MIALYAQTKNLGFLPTGTCLWDMRPDHYAYFAIFSAAEAEYLHSQDNK